MHITRVALAFLFSAATAQAQDAALLRAFSGEWFSFEPRMGTGQPCAVALSVDPAPNGGLTAATQNCAAPLDQVTVWGIIDGKIRLVGPQGPIAALGGHQLRMSGEIAEAGQAVVLDRASGDLNAQALSRALATYRCLFLGYSATCATPQQSALPKWPDDADVQITALVDLNLRAQPRSDAPVKGILTRNTQTEVRSCVVTSDGPWCWIAQGESQGWVARNALRQDTWPVLTYTFVR